MTDKEIDLLKTELLSRTQTPFGAAKWLKGENGIARITIPREDVSLVLYSNRDIGGGISSYEVVHQIAKQRSSADGRDRRFDVTLLINGLPIVQIELKQVTAKDAYKKITEFVFVDNLDEHTSIETRVDYVKAFQAFNRAYESLVTYDEFNDEIVKSPTLLKQVQTLEDQIGIYNTIKGSLIDDSDCKDPIDLSDIEFYGNDTLKLYDIDAAYIDQLLGNYLANDSGLREEIEKALQKLNKSEEVRNVYRAILNAVDTGVINKEDDIFVVKRKFFSDAVTAEIDAFADEWFIKASELFYSKVQYKLGQSLIPNMGAIIGSKNYDGYKALHSDAKPFKYAQDIKRAWREVLDKKLMPLEDELK